MILHQPSLAVERKVHGLPGIHWDTRTQHAGHWEIYHTHVRPNKHLHSCEQSYMCRKKLFTKKIFSEEDSTNMCCSGTACQKGLSSMQGDHIWSQTLTQQPVLPSPSSWGWIKTSDGLYELHWTTPPEASKTGYGLVSCGCLRKCVVATASAKRLHSNALLSVCKGECSKNWTN